MAWQPKQTVIVPIDFSDSSADAVQEAIRFADSAASVHVVHVVFDFEPLPAFGQWNHHESDWFPVRHDTAHKHLETYLHDNGFEDTKPVTLVGDAGLEITAYAREVGAELIVIPSHGYHGLNRLLLGSTTERVLRHAHCPVYVLRRPDAE